MAGPVINLLLIKCSMLVGIVTTFLSDDQSSDPTFVQPLFEKNGPTQASFSFIFVFSNALQFLQQINVKNFHPVYGARIRTHNLWNMSLLP